MINLLKRLFKRYEMPSKQRLIANMYREYGVKPWWN